MRSTKEPRVSRSTAADRLGLTVGAFTQLGLAFSEAPNPHYKSGPPMCLYLEADLLRPEIQARAAELRAAGAKRRASATAAAERRAAALVAEAMAADLGLSWPGSDPSQLIREAWRHAVGGARSEGRAVDNYLRHQCSNYDRIWATFAGRVGREAAYEALRDRIDDEILNYLYDRGWADLAEAVFADRRAAALSEVDYYV